MAGLLDQYNPQIDGLGLGLLGASQALLTPRRKGGGVGAAFGAFGGGLLQGEQMQRARMQDARRDKIADAELGMRQERLGMDRERFGAERQQYADQQAAQRAQMERIQQVRAQIALEKPDLLPLFDMNPQEAMKRLFPEEADKVVPSGGAVVRGGKEVYKNPREIAPPAPTDLGKMISEMNALPQGDPRRALYAQAIQKSTTHAPAANMSVHTGTMVPVEGPNGPMYVMPTKTGEVTPVPGLVPPGTKRAQEADAANAQSSLDRSSLMLNKINSALEKVGFLTTAIPGAVAGKVPGTDAYDLRAEVQTIQANFGFQELAQMRASSPTGGALGQVAVKELELLQAAVQNLDPNQSTEQLRKNLNSAKQHVTNWRNTVQMAGGKRPMVPGPAAPATQQTSPDGRTVSGTIGAPSIDDLVKKYANPR